MNPAPELFELSSGALRVVYSSVPWDSAVFGFHVAQIVELELRGELDAADADAAPFEDWCRRTSARLVSCRLPHDCLRETGWLESRGFRFIEMVYRPRLERLQERADAAGAIVVGRVGADDLPAVERIAETVFTTSRFRLDPHLDPVLSDRRYRHWARTSLADPTRQVLKAELDNALVGFFIVEERADGSAYWHLTAIAPGHQGRGVGRAVWQAMLERHRRAGLQAVETTVSAHNLPVLSLYGRLGFRFAAADITLHRAAFA